MAVIHHNTTMRPTEMELLVRWLPEQPWFQGAADRLTRAGGFRLDDPAGEVGIEFLIVVTGDGQAWLVPMTYRGEPLGGAAGALIGTAQHGALGSRWIYDGERDPVLRAQLAALLRGEVMAQAQNESHTLDPSVHVRPADGVTSVELRRLLTDGDSPPGSAGQVSAPWRRLDGSLARGIIAIADRPY